MSSMRRLALDCFRQERTFRLSLVGSRRLADHHHFALSQSVRFDRSVRAVGRTELHLHWPNESSVLQPDNGWFAFAFLRIAGNLRRVRAICRRDLVER